MPYIRPQNVLSPRDKVGTIHEVIYDGGPASKGKEPWSLVRLTYSGNPAVGLRWNGSDQEPLGYPSGRGQAVWFILPDELASLFVDIAREKSKTGGVPSLSTEALVKMLRQRGYKVILEVE